MHAPSSAPLAVQPAPFPPPVRPAAYASETPRAGRAGVPAPYTAPGLVVPDFPTIRAGHGGVRRLLPRLPRRRRPLAAGMAVAAAVLAVSAAYDPPPPHERRAVARHPVADPSVSTPVRAAVDRLVKAPVRIADAEAVRLLRPGDRVDVLAATRVVASGVTVIAIPEQTGRVPADPAFPDAAGAEAPRAAVEPGQTGGALVVLAVPRGVAAALSGAAVSNPLAVALC